VIEMKCPSCKVAGRVSKDKVNTRLVCRKCLSVFHITPTGRAVLGEPPQAAVTTPKAPREKYGLHLSLEVPPWLRRVAGVVFSPRLLSVVGVLIVLVGGYTAVSIFRGESLQERATKVARAVVIGDLGILLELTATGTGDDTLKWYNAVRPQCDELRSVLRTPTPYVEVLVKNEDSGSGTAQVVARVTAQEPLSRTASGAPDLGVGASASNKSIDLPLTLTSEGMAGWMLDGTRTLAAIPKIP